MPVAPELAAEIKAQKNISATNKTVEAARAISEGQVPSNAALHSVIDTAESTLEQQAATQPLSSKGQRIVEHTQELLHTTARAIEEKNAGEKLQTLVKETAKAADEVQPSATQAATSSRRIQNQAAESQRAISAIARLLVRSSEFRGALNNLLDILQDVFVRDQPGKGGVAEPLRQKADAEVNAPSYQARQYMSWGDAAQSTAQNVTNVGQALANDSNTSEGWTIPQEKKEELADRLRDVLTILTRDSEFKTGTRNFISLIENVSDSAKSAVREIETRADASKHTDKVEQAAKELVEEFTGNKSVDPFLNHSRALIRKIRNDSRLSAWVSDTKRMVEQVLDNPAVLDNQSWRNQASELFDRARDLAHRYDYDNDWRQVNDEGRELLDAFKNDALLNELEEKGKLLASDIVYVDDQNNVYVDFESLAEVRKIIMPLVMDQLQAIPVPRLEFSDESYDGVLDNIVLSIRDIAPDHIHIRTTSDTDIRLDQLDTTTDSEIRITMEGMRTHLANVKFYFNRKSFPKIEDSGTVDAELGGDGARLVIVLSVERKQGQPITFRGSDITFDLSELSLKFRDDVTHPILLKMWATYARKKLAHQAEELVKERVRLIVDDINVQLNALMKQMYANTKARMQQASAKVESHAQELAEEAKRSGDSKEEKLGGSSQMTFGQFGATSQQSKPEEHHLGETFPKPSDYPSMF